MLFFKKIFSSKGIIIIASVLLIAFLFSVIGIIAEKTKSEPVGTVTAENYSSVLPTIYTLEVQNEFKSGIREFIMDFLGLTDTNLISLDSGKELLSCFRDAGISGEKALSLSRYLKDIVDPSDVFDLENAQNKEDLRGVFALIAFFSDVEISIEEGTGREIKKLVFNPEKYIMNIFDLDMYLSAMSEITDNTMLTFDEIARIGYEIIFAQSQSSELIDRDEFVTVFRSMIYLSSLLTEFNSNGGSMTQARLISELIYQSGSEMNAILLERGIDAILNSFGFSSPFPSLALDPQYSEIMQEEWIAALDKLDEVRELVTTSRDTTEFTLVMIINSMINIENMGLEGIARSQAEATENPRTYLYLSMISISRSLTKGLEKGYLESETIKDKMQLASGLASIVTQAMSIETGFESETEMQQYEQEKYDEIILYLATVEAVQTEFNGIYSIEDASSLSEAQINSLSESYDTFSQNSSTFYDGFNSIFSTIFVNTALNLYLQAYDLMLEE